MIFIPIVKIYYQLFLFLASNYTIIYFHWPCYCTVYVISMSVEVCNFVSWSESVNTGMLYCFFCVFFSISVWYSFMLLRQIKNDNIIMKYIPKLLIFFIIFLCKAVFNDIPKVFLFDTSLVTVNSRNGKTVTRQCIVGFIITISPR